LAQKKGISMVCAKSSAKTNNGANKKRKRAMGGGGGVGEGVRGGGKEGKEKTVYRGTLSKKNRRGIGVTI